MPFNTTLVGHLEEVQGKSMLLSFRAIYVDQLLKLKRDTCHDFSIQGPLTLNPSRNMRIRRNTKIVYKFSDST